MKRFFKKIIYLLILLSMPHGVSAANFDYQLTPMKIADNTYVFVGKTEDFSFKNGGNIINTGFIVTSEGIIVIDTGSSLRYGQQMKAAIKTVSDKPINRVYITHHHPDHFLGNQAFKGASIIALASTIKSINSDGAGFTDNLYLMVGDWMRGTDVLVPDTTTGAGKVTVGGHELEILALSGHTHGDMAIFDHTTGVMFSGDLIFHKRTLTTPHANISDWLATLKILRSLPIKVLVPGHGSITHDKQPISETEDYLIWLDAALSKAANDGFSMTDVINIELPQRFHANSLLKSEFSRSVTHLYSSYENRVFKRVN